MRSSVDSVRAQMAEITPFTKLTGGKNNIRLAFGCSCKVGGKKRRAPQLILQVMPLICHSTKSFLLLPSPVRVGVFSKSKKCQELGLMTQGHSKKKINKKVKITDCFDFYFYSLLLFFFSVF